MGVTNRIGKLAGLIVGNRFLLCLLTSLLWLGCQDEAQKTAAYPQRPIKLIVPFGAGGGSDTFARILAKAIEDQQLLTQPLVIINVPGAGGTIGSRRLKHARPDGYTLMQLHEGILTSKYAGRVNYGPEAFEVIAGMGASTMLIAVGQNSSYQNLTELMQAATERPDEVIFSANIGAPSQFAGLMLEKASPGARFRYSQTGDGSKRFAGLQGGHTDVSAFSLAEYIQFKSSGLHAIGLLGHHRHPEAMEVPTAMEQGYDVISTNMQFWWAPKGTHQKKLEVIAESLRAAMQSPEVQIRLSQLRMDPVLLFEDELQTELTDRAERAAAVAQRPTVQLPDFPLWIMGMVGVLAVSTITQSSLRAKRSQSNAISGSVPAKRIVKSNWHLVLLVLTLTVIYVATMQAELTGYRLATFFYLAGLGSLFSFRHRQLLGTMAVVSIVLSVGLHYLFTEVFVIDLP